jgi:tRNA-dihydrouridine synthase
MFEGSADWSKIKELKQSVNIPVIGSGDLFSAGDIIAMLDRTGCDGVMVARGALGYPWIFREALDILAGLETALPTNEERLATALRHLELYVDLAGERTAVQEMRKHFSWYARGIAGASRFRTMVNLIEGKETVIQALLDFFGNREG